MWGGIWGGDVGCSGAEMGGQVRAVGWPGVCGVIEEECVGLWGRHLWGYRGGMCGVQWGTDAGTSQGCGVQWGGICGVIEQGSVGL